MELHLEWLGLVSSFLWAVAFIVAVIPVNRLGSFAFNRWRMLCSSMILGCAALCTGGYGNISAHQVILMCNQIWELPRAPPGCVTITLDDPREAD